MNTLRGPVGSTLLGGIPSTIANIIKGPPQPPKPPPAPDPNDPLALANARQQAAKNAVARGSRASTILSQPGGADYSRDRM